MQVPGYPEYFERWWIDYAQKVFSCSNLYDCEAAIREQIQSLTDFFTLQRNQIYAIRYEPKLTAAYGLFYFPETFVRVQFPLVELLHRGWQPKKQLSVLDLGSGTGAAGFSAALVLKDLVDEINLTAIDQSPAALEISIRIADELAAFLPHLRQTTIKGDISSACAIPDEAWDVIVLSFSLNELALRMDDSALFGYFERLITMLSPQGLLLILEPALRETSEGLEILRDKLCVAGQCHIWAPCLHHEPCPLLSEGKFWCHEVRRWSPPTSLQFLNRHLHRIENVLKFSFLALGKRPPVFNAPPGAFRMLSPWTKTKGKWIASGCATDGAKHEYQILKRDTRENEIEQLKKSGRGDTIIPGLKIRRIIH